MLKKYNKNIWNIKRILSIITFSQLSYIFSLWLKYIENVWKTHV